MSGSDSRCAQIQPLLSEVVDGEASAATVARVEAHLKECFECASEIGFLRATRTVLAQSYPEVHSPASLYSAIAQATYARPAWHTRLGALFAPAPVRLGFGAAVAAGVVAAIVVPQIGYHVAAPLSQTPARLAANRDHSVAHPAPPLSKPAQFAATRQQNTPSAIGAMAAVNAHGTQYILPENMPGKASASKIDARSNKYAATEANPLFAARSAPTVTLPTHSVASPSALGAEHKATFAHPAANAARLALRLAVPHPIVNSGSSIPSGPSASNAVHGGEEAPTERSAPNALAANTNVSQPAPADSTPSTSATEVASVVPTPHGTHITLWGAGTNAPPKFSSIAANITRQTVRLVATNSQIAVVTAPAQ